MRTKSYGLAFTCILATTVILLIFNDRRSNFHNLFTRQLKDNIQNIKDKFEGITNEKQLENDEKYLSLLGFGENARLYPDDVWHNSSLPVVVSYVKEGDTEQGVGLARNIGHFLPNHTLLIYNVGLAKSDVQALLTHCNSSRCILVDYDLSVFPSHVYDSKLHAFRPLVIQDALSRAGAVLYLDNRERLRTSRIGPLVNRSATTSVLTWRTHQRPVTTLTHPHMFLYFKASSDNFIFVPMVGLARLLVFNTDSVHANVMLPWVQCALTQDCIIPVGAQSGGCRFDKKPFYRYSGCHSYDVSALNIVLGLHFKFESELYALKDHPGQYFRRVGSHDTALELAALQENTTADGLPTPS
ncbi:hypothetical protein AAG570_009782 [Ranatra chinensis]|uniref:Uncharacterized protein n=1 Tax=Ranatra chinensis TaxID=642074 RepID=A0ABD0Z0V8_9HEMI